MPFKELYRIRVEDYDSAAHQFAAQGQLERIAIEQVMRDEGTTDWDKGLITLVDRTNVLTPHAPQGFSSHGTKNLSYARAFYPNYGHLRLLVRSLQQSSPLIGLLYPLGNRYSSTRNF